MDLLKGSYAHHDDDDGSDDDGSTEEMLKPVSATDCKSLSLPCLDLTPMVSTRFDVGGTVCIDPTTKELSHNPKYEHLFQPLVSLS
jgi:hypothetical protein